MTGSDGFLRVVASAGIGELVWRDPTGRPAAHGVVPLLLGDRPAVALPWSLERQAREAAAGGVAALVLSDPRVAGPAWTPLALVGAPVLVEDPDGDLVREHLLSEELRKHPPSRALADSPLLRREHWWYLPRLVLALDVTGVVPVAGRGGPSDAVLAVAPGAGDLVVAVVRVGDWDAHPVPVAPLPAGAPGGPPPGPLPPDGPALLVGQEVSVPDVERWTVHVTRGRHERGWVAVDERPARRALEPVPGLLARWRRQRALERACVSALRAHSRRSGPRAVE